jgi:chromosomal replication initiation ATPase DnaA
MIAQYKELHARIERLSKENLELRGLNGRLSTDNFRLKQMLRQEYFEENLNNVDLIQNIKNYIESIYVVDLGQRRRTRELVEARAMFYYFAKKYTTKSLKQIAAYAGNVHHATVINGIRVAEDLFDTDKDFKANILKHDAIIVERIIRPNLLKVM